MWRCGDGERRSKIARKLHACFRLLVVGGIFAASGLYLSFGTLRPCCILREAIRQQDNFGAILPDGLINFAVEQYGPMLDDRCSSILLQQTVQIEPPSLRLETPHSIIKGHFSFGNRAADVERSTAVTVGDRMRRQSNLR